MRYWISFLIILTGLNPILSQNISYEDLIENKSFINIDKEQVLLPTDDGTWKNQKFSKLIDILNEDLFSYYGLNSTYSTPLQKQTFQKSEEYTQMLLPQFKEICNKVKGASFYTLFDLRYNEPYNITKHNFSFRIGVNDYNTTTTVGYIGLGKNFCVSYPQSRTTIKKSKTSYGDYFIQQYISTPTVPEDIAITIEKGMESPYCPISLLFVVKPTKVSKEKISMNYGGYVGTQTAINENILSKTIGLYIVNTKTKEVLADLSSIFQTTTPQKKK